MGEAARSRLHREEGLAVESIAQHMLPGYDGPAGLVIGFGSTPEPGLELAAQVIARVVLEESDAKETAA